MFKIIFISIVFFIGGCHHSIDKNYVQYKIEKSDFSDIEIKAFNDASTRLNSWVGYSAVSLSNDSEYSIRRDDSISPFAGFYYNSGNIGIDILMLRRQYLAYLDSRYYIATLQVVIMHELLHSLGMKHISEKGLMNETPEKEFTQADKDACIAAGICK